LGHVVGGLDYFDCPDAWRDLFAGLVSWDFDPVVWRDPVWNIPVVWFVLAVWIALVVWVALVAWIDPDVWLVPVVWADPVVWLDLVVSIDPVVLIDLVVGLVDPGTWAHLLVLVCPESGAIQVDVAFPAVLQVLDSSGPPGDEAILDVRVVRGVITRLVQHLPV